MSQIVDLFVAALLMMAVLGVLAKKWNLAYPILLVFGGLLLGMIPGLPHFEIGPELIFFFFLPPLLFPAAMFIPWRDFRANLRPILFLAVGLVLFTTVSVGWLAHYLFGLPLAAGFVLGAIISPPDAIAASAIAQRLRLPRRIVTILEGESLINDATALVAYRFGVAALATGSFSLAHATGEFVMVALGGILIGVAIGWLAAWFHRRVEDPPIEITVSFLTPFLAYILAERIGVSGVLAVVAAGLFLGWRLPEITTSTTRLQGGPFWNMVEFILNGFVFILIGLKVPEATRALSGKSIYPLVGKALLISVAVILIRIVWVFSVTYVPRFLFKKLRERDPSPRWQNVAIVAWTGMRGVVSVAAALALPFTITSGSPFPERDLILFLTFVVIAATLVVQGLTLPWLIRWLGIEDDRGAEKEEREARIQANQAALNGLISREQRGGLNPTEVDAIQRLRIEYEDRLRELESYNAQEGESASRIFSTAYDELSKEALKSERKTILKLRNENVIN
ncbi:MAG: Na+/H+ antiporter, partial [Verrucomicrobiales bacterium]|nr:Na+/H+ antiporter [Verrucomicrobiales bacterium]